MQADYGFDSVVHFEHHVSETDPFCTDETLARYEWYGLNGAPAVVIDGSSRVLGTTNCGSAGSKFRNAVNQRMGATGWTSPVRISAHMGVEGALARVTANYALVDPVALSNLRATFVLYEDNVEWCCGSGEVHTWHGVTRRILTEPIVLQRIGDEATVTMALPIDPGWDAGELHAVAFLQDSVSKEIFQGQVVRDLSVVFLSHIDSVPDGSAAVHFPGTLRNLLATEAEFTLRITNPFGDWPTEFFVGGDPQPHTAPFRLAIAPGGSCDLALHARTDTSKVARSGTFEVTCESTGSTERNDFRVFNGTPAVILVDHDWGSAYEASMMRALGANGVLFDRWNVMTRRGTPPLGKMKGADIVIWLSEGAVTDVLTDGDAVGLSAFLDSGGALFLASNYYLNALQTQDPSFARAYLGVDSGNLDLGYRRMDGVAGDEIGDGMVLPLIFPHEEWASGGDGIVPTETATTDFVAEGGSRAMIRNTTPGGARSVFLAQRFDAISEDDPDPDNARTLVRRIFDWLRPQGNAGLDDPPGADALREGVRIVDVIPNPFRGGVRIAFFLPASDVAIPVRLDILDVSGRRAATVLDETLAPGPHVVRWEGRDEAGRRVARGAYLARLVTPGGTSSAKALLSR
ncbi:MAG: hypothetical protein QUU85_09820 [Candidatus Eisenbacteria bacterium]|nr:hypothetical protein [Candidatus Eisenbacteria bacterium]